MELVAFATVMFTALMASMFTALATLTGFAFLTFTFLVLPALLALTVLATVFVVDPNDVVGRSNCEGPLERGARLPTNHIPQEPPQTAERVVKLTLNVALPAFVEGYHMPADGTPDAYPLRLASNILSEGEVRASIGGWFMTSRLPWKRRAPATSRKTPISFLCLPS